MVLQTKIFLITLLSKFTPYSSKRRTFINRVKSAVKQSFRGSVSIDIEQIQLFGSDPPQTILEETVTPQNESLPRVPLDLERGYSSSIASVTPVEAMSMFTKIPFPEPRRVTYLHQRELP